MFGLPFDIRHIDFASSHRATAVWCAPELATLAGVLSVLGSVAVIGLVNFVVSFGLTLSVAIDARRLDGVDWRAGIRGVAGLALARPLAFFVPPRRSGGGGYLRQLMLARAALLQLDQCARTSPSVRRVPVIGRRPAPGVERSATGRLRSVGRAGGDPSSAR